MNSQHKFHNRHNLTPEQVGDGYRLLLETASRAELKAAHAAEPSLTYHQWRGDDRGRVVAPTSNDAWESLLRTNADISREVAKLKETIAFLTLQLGGVVTACHLEGYNVGEPLGEWLTKQFADAKANLTELLKARAALRVIRGALP